MSHACIISVPVPSRPYARQKDSPPSVTQIIDLLSKPGLSWAAARETATFAVLHPDQWQHLEPDTAVERLRRHHRGVWDSRAAMGTLCHQVLESFSHDEEIDIQALINWTLEHDHKAKQWRERNANDLTEAVLGYVLGIEKWWADYMPEVLHTEVVVRTPGRYIGTCDLRARIAGDDWLIDLKTSSQQDEDKGVYIDSYVPQLTAYAFAEETVEYEAWREDGKVKVREVGTGPWTVPDRLGVIHVRGDEGYTFYELPLDKAHHDVFLKMADVVAWRKALPEMPKVVGRGEAE